MNARSLVSSNRTAPVIPPPRLSAASTGRRRGPASASSRRWAQAAIRLAGTSATVLEALAATGGMPAASMAGKVKKVAPPAIALTVPPAKPATTRSSVSRKFSRRPG